MSQTLKDVVEKLEKRHGRPKGPPTDDPFELVLWENVGYLVDDERRLETYERLKKQIGLEPRDLLAAPRAKLVEAIRPGGMLPEGRAEKLVRAATLAEDVGQPLSKIVKGPIAQARKVLQRFPGIGKPGADRLLALSGAAPVLGLDSNALRVLVRLGFGREHKDYARTYREVQERLAPELPKDVRFCRRAYVVLRHHGQTVCRRSAPECGACPLRATCPSALT